MKARWVMKCECCKAAISTGSQFSMFAGRPWKTDHLIAYQRRRRTLAASGSSDGPRRR